MVKELNVSKEIKVDDNIRLVLADESYKDAYYNIKASLDGVAKMLEFEEYRTVLWEECETFAMYMIELDDQPIGIVVLKDFNESIEIGCDVHSDFQNKGIGQKAAKTVIDYLKNQFPDFDLYFRAYNDNLRSLHIIKKLGGVFVENEPSDVEKAKPVLLEFLTTNGMDIPEGFDEPDEQFIEVYKFV